MRDETSKDVNHDATDQDPLSEDDVLLHIWEFTELVGASARSLRQRDRVLRAAGVSIPPASFGILRLVHRHGPVAVGDVARGMRIDQSTASRQLRPLEEHGLVERTSQSDDRRVSQLNVTDAGAEVLRRTRAVALHDFEVALADWDPDDRAQLALLLDRFRAGLLDARPDETGWSYRPAVAERRTA